MEAQQIKTLRAPTQRTLYTEPITEIIADKKIKLKTCKDTFLFILSSKHPNIIFIQHKGHITRLNKLLKPYTEEEETRQQFIKLLEEPAIIQDKEKTLIIIETIYIFSNILNMDLTDYITYSSLNNLTHYYFMLYKINKNKQEAEEQQTTNKKQ